MKLYDDPMSGNGYKVRLLLAHLSRPYEYVPVDILKNEARTPAFLEKNPNGRIPVLELDDGCCLAESNAILYYLAQGSEYWPEDMLLQAQVMQWLFFEQYSHEPNIATPRFWLKTKVYENDVIGSELLSRKQEAGRATLTVMDGHLASSTFFVGERYGIADIALYAYTHVAEEGGFELSAYPSVVAWLGRVAAQPNHVTIHEWRAA